jgi:hypothetical protein
VCNIAHIFWPVSITVLERMKDQTKERWFQLCQLAAVEEDPNKLLALVTEINTLLERRQQQKTDSRRSDLQDRRNGDGDSA